MPAESLTELAWPEAGRDGWVDAGYGVLERPKPGCPGVVERVVAVPPRGWLRSRSAAPAKPTATGRPNWMLVPTQEPTPQEYVELRLKSEPRITVGLRERVWHELHDHARESSDGRESGGFLFGLRIRSWHQRVAVDWVTRMVRERAEQSCKLDIGALVAEEGMLRASGFDHAGEQGSWHTHPAPSDGHPSPRDLDTWLNARDFLDTSHYIGLILTADPSDERWSKPRAHAWIVRRDDFKRAVCEPGLVELVA